HLACRTYLPSTLPAAILGQNQRSIEQQRPSVRFATIEPQPKPTVLGILAVGKDPRQFLPGAYIQFLRIDGMDLADPIKDQDEVDGPLPDLFRRLDEKLLSHVSVTSDPTAQP